MAWRCYGIQCFHFCFFFRANGEKEHFDENNSRHRYSNYLKSVILKVTWAQLCSNLKRHLKDTFQLKIFRTWINIGANLFLGTYHETKINEADSNGVWTHKHLFRKRTLNHLAICLHCFKIWIDFILNHFFAVSIQQKA